MNSKNNDKINKFNFAQTRTFEGIKKLLIDANVNLQTDLIIDDAECITKVNIYVQLKNSGILIILVDCILVVNLLYLQR
jgi:hypothetical protein